MSDKSTVTQEDSLDRASKIVTHGAIALPVALASIKISTDLPSVIWGLGLAAWILLGLIAVMLHCTVYLASRQARISKQVKCLRGCVDELQATESRATRAAAITAALDDNITPINHNRR